MDIPHPFSFLYNSAWYFKFIFKAKAVLAIGSLQVIDMATGSVINSEIPDMVHTATQFS